MHRHLSSVFAILVVLILVAASCAADFPDGASEQDAAGGRFEVCSVSEKGSHDDAELTVHDDDADAGHADAGHADDGHADAGHADDGHADDGHDDAGADEGLTSADVQLAFEIEMTEFAYGCKLPDIAAGTVVALRFTNAGLIAHEAVIGDRAAQDEAEQTMAAMSEGEAMHGHDVPSVTVQPGDEAELIIRLGDPADLIVGCHIPGHWDAGMHTQFQVTEV